MSNNAGIWNGEKIPTANYDFFLYYTGEILLDIVNLTLTINKVV